jgi:hypothetical protein
VPKVRVQSLVNGPELMEWFFATDVWKRMHQLGDGGEFLRKRA